MNKTRFLIVPLMVTGLASCAQDAGPKESLGTLGGAVIGGIAGAQFGKGSGRLAAVGIGTLLGALAGSEIGKSLDKADRLYMHQTTNSSLESEPSGQVSTWKNPDSGNSGTIVPQPAYQDAQGQYCREFQQTVTVAGKTESAYGTACRQPDGAWKVAS